MVTADVVATLLRIMVGGTIAAHGWNHLFGPGGVRGTAAWFGSMGLRPARLHAALSGFGELAAGAALVLGFVTPLASAFVVGTMTVAAVIAHRSNGFYVFRDGYEYVLMLGGVAMCIGILGPGPVSLDRVLGIETGMAGVTGAAIAASGIPAAAVLLVVSWRPKTVESASADA